MLQEIFGLEENLKKAPADDPDSLKCVICINDDKNTIVMPCGHLCICKDCAKELAKGHSPDCPVC